MWGTLKKFSKSMAAHKTVFLCIPHYIFTSDLLRTHYIEYLASRYRVVVLTSMLDEAAAKAGGYFQSPGVTYIKKPLEHPKLWDRFKFLRISLVNEFDYLASVRHFYKRPNYKNNWKRRLARLLGLPFKKWLTADFFTGWESRKLPDSGRFLELVKEYNPALILTATPGFDSWEAEMIIWAKRAGIPSVAVNFTWDNLTMNAKHIRKTDYLICWNDAMKREAEAIHHYPPERVFVSGTPRFDPYFEKEPKPISREEFLRSKGLDPNKKTIFHTTVTRAYPFQKKYIRDLLALRAAGRIPGVNIFIRIHPLDLPENYREFSGAPNLCIEKAGAQYDGKVEMSRGDLLNLKHSLQYTDVNINYASTITIEACIFDKPVINIGYLDSFALAYEFNHYEPISKSGAVRIAKTDNDLPELINEYLTHPDRDQEARRKVVDDYVVFTDGLSYKRSVDILETI